MEEKGISRFPKPIHGRIPNFVGAEKASRNLEELDIFKKSSIIKVNPDSPQRPVRASALNSGKVLLMPTPRLGKGFILLDPKTIPSNLVDYASTIKGAFKYGRIVKLGEIPEIGLIVIGSVAVSPDGTRLGKGEGYGDIEFGILREVGVIKDSVIVATTVHEIQIVDKIPFEEHDLTVDLVVTPNKVIETRARYAKPRGIVWSKIDLKKMRAISILKVLRGEKGSSY